jgi:PAS domain S-box-containing protein
MITHMFSAALWIILIALDVAISARLAKMYRKDSDTRKLMFIIGLLMCINVHVTAIVGIDSFPIATNISNWAPLPIILAFIFSTLHEKCRPDPTRCYKIFLTGTALTIIMFFVPPAIDFSQPVISAGLVLAAVLTLAQLSKGFDLSSVTLFFFIPSFAVSYLSIGQGLTELALFAAFTARGVLLMALEISKTQGGKTAVLFAKKELYVQEYNFNKLFNMLPDPAAIIDPKGTILAVSPVLVSLSGLKREELVGTNFLKTDLISDRSKFKMVQYLGSILIDLEIPPYEIEVQSKDGKKGQFEVNTSKIDYRGTTAAMVVFRDLTERNRLLEKIKREQMRFQDIAERTGDWIWELDSEGKFIYSNPVVSKIVGYSSEEIIGKKARDVLVPSSGKHEEFFVPSAIKTGNISPKIMECSLRDGRLITLEIQAMPLSGLDGELVGYRGVCRDFTEKQEMEKKLLKAERFAAIGELSTMVAHDLRNPLQGISNVIHVLKKTAKNTGNNKLASLVPSIEEALNHAEKMVRELLDYSTDIRLELNDSNPTSVVNQALSRISFPENITLVQNTNPEPRIRVDTDKFARVIVNIVTNAFEAMSKGGILKIESKELEGCLQLSIADNGTGIPDEKIDKLWSPFITTRAQGIGLGLPICKRIVEAHGGRILVETEKGKGTTFTIVLPLTKIAEKNVEFCIDERGIIDAELKDSK